MRCNRSAVPPVDRYESLPAERIRFLPKGFSNHAGSTITTQASMSGSVAVMTAIAARAGAAIGSLYQFFPTKEALTEALQEDCTGALFQQLETLQAQAEGRDIDWLAAFLVAFRWRHPVLAVLVDPVSIPSGHSMAIRRRLRAELQALLGRYLPRLSPGALRAATVAVQQLMKAAVAVNAEPGLSGRKAALEQLKTMLRLYYCTPSPRTEDHTRAYRSDVQPSVSRFRSVRKNFHEKMVDTHDRLP